MHSTDLFNCMVWTQRNGICEQEQYFFLNYLLSLNAQMFSTWDIQSNLRIILGLECPDEDNLEMFIKFAAHVLWFIYLFVCYFCRVGVFLNESSVMGHSVSEVRVKTRKFSMNNICECPFTDKNGSHKS